MDNPAKTVADDFHGKQLTNLLEITQIRLLCAKAYTQSRPGMDESIGARIDDISLSLAQLIEEIGGNNA